MATKVINFLSLCGLTWFVPFVKLASGECPKEQLREILSVIGIPVVSVLIFFAFWSFTAAQIKTSLGNLPGPVAVWEASKTLIAEHRDERAKEKAFYQRQEERNAKRLAKDPQAEVRIRKYTGKPTYFDQIGTSLITVFAGFLIATLLALPIGILCGLNKYVMTAFSPLIQIFKPVSPLAWLPIVTMVVSALYTTNDGMFEKSFINSAITVALCSLWATLINTALGVASIDKDYINVARVLRLGNIEKIVKVVIPASLPYIFAGLRISLGVGWMVLIAAEMLAQNPGLGKFVWDEFQNGSSHSLARILVAVFTIGIIGFMLDRIMVVFQKLVSFGQDVATA